MRWSPFPIQSTTIKSFFLSFSLDCDQSDVKGKTFEYIHFFYWMNSIDSIYWIFHFLLLWFVQSMKKYFTQRKWNSYFVKRIKFPGVTKVKLFMIGNGQSISSKKKMVRKLLKKLLVILLKNDLKFSYGKFVENVWPFLPDWLNSQGNLYHTILFCPLYVYENKWTH